MIKILEAIKSYIGYIMAIIGITSFIFSLGIKHEAQRSKNVLLEDKVNSIIQIQEDQSSRILNMDKNIFIIGNSLYTLSKSQEALVKSYKNILLRDKTLTTKEFYEYMEGLELKKITEINKIDTSKINITKK